MIITPAMTRMADQFRALKMISASHGVERKLHDLEAEGEDFVGVNAARLESEMNPAKNERERDGKREETAPRHEHVPVTARLAPVADEFLAEELDDEMPHQLPAVGNGSSR